MNFDLNLGLRRIDPQRVVSPAIAVEPPSMVEPPIATDLQLLLDTCVYIDVLQGKTTCAVNMLLEVRLVNHSVVCLSELTHLFGRLDPADSRTRIALKELTAVVGDIPDHRLGAPLGASLW